MFKGLEATGGLLSEAVSNGLAREDTTMAEEGLSSFLDVSAAVSVLLLLVSLSSASCLCIFMGLKDGAVSISGDGC